MRAGERPSQLGVHAAPDVDYFQQAQCSTEAMQGCLCVALRSHVGWEMGGTLFIPNWKMTLCYYTITIQ